ncbi:MAG: rod shape-determining protein MreD [Candidatus Moranbacteria bacterium]|nr:rod shape-determining protein MreD [Candidatus Moranbacteria bacterium]
MLQKIIIFFIIFFFAIFQYSVFPNFFFWGLGPNILLLLVIFWTTQVGFEGAFFKNILAGFMLDLGTFQLVGTNVAAFVTVAFFISFISKRFLVIARNWRIFILSLTIIFSTLANNLFLNALFSVANYFGKAVASSAQVPFFSMMLVKEIALNLLFFPLVYFTMKKMERSNLLQVRKKIY